MISIHDGDALESLRARFRLDPELVRRLRNGFYKKHRPVEELLATIPEPARGIFREQVSFHVLELHSRHDSQRDGAGKLIFRTPGGHLIESVILRIGTGRTSLCVSSQVGCAARCAFCATGKMGLAVNLTRDEILDQLAQANRLLQPEGRSIRNLVFMGMGEPFHNENEVYAALEVLLSPRCFERTPGRVTVSTVGLPDAMRRCAERFPGLGIALSLHSACQEGRERILPLARKYPLRQLREALLAIASPARPVLIEYLMLDGINDTETDLAALIDFLRGISVHINLIPYNPIDDAPDLRATGPERIRTFAEALNQAGFVVTVRYSLGADIAAACGQLVRRENSRRGRVALPGFGDH